MVPSLAARLCGSPDLYESGQREPWHSINFVTCHDGFTLADLVAYNEKHNEANGESSRDGSDTNWSWNCGVEGPTGEKAIQELRSRQMRNFLALLLVSHGVPMLLAGDEFGRTQRGNNNAYCQDNDISWVDWAFAEQNADMLDWTRRLIRFRHQHAVLRRQGFAGTDIRIEWHGIRQGQPDWSHGSRSLAMYITGAGAEGRAERVYVIASAYWGDLTFELPPDLRWRIAFDSARPGVKNETCGNEVAVHSRSVVILDAE
jgi:glycogen operon protein